MHQEAAAATTRDELTRGMVGAAIAVTVWGSAGVIVKHIDLDGLALGGYRFSITPDVIHWPRSWNGAGRMV